MGRESVAVHCCGSFLNRAGNCRIVGTRKILGEPRLYVGLSERINYGNLYADNTEIMDRTLPAASFIRYDLLFLQYLYLQHIMKTEAKDFRVQYSYCIW